MIVVGFGGGTDSTAVLAGWVEKGLRVTRPLDAILFADTGNEKPETYAHIEFMQFWLDYHHLPPITIVRKGGRQETLEENCLRKKTLPSIAFGRKKCSHVFKIEPQEKFLNNHPVAKAWWKAGRTRGPDGKFVYANKVTKLIGYDYSEEKRWAKAALEDTKYRYEYPLVQWEWTREDCIAALRRAGIPQPGKSACWFCPSSTKPEIDQLRRVHPLLFQRALEMEDNAENLKTTKGLGRRFSWRDYATTTAEPDSVACMACQDG